ncbi:MAG: LacI family transcriptional regulator [Anaerolineae bacterium]|jgi:LacI family transcriptional regulator|nr:LacI family transcriptional regulator [Anaerolineae bacterium]
MPTIRDVARRAGVAPITVSRVINNAGYISEATRQRVEQAIAELHYVPNSLSRSLRFKKTDTIAFIVSDITNPFWTTVTRGIEDASSEHGFNVILCNTDENPAKQDNYVTVLLQKQTDGFLLVPAGENAGVVQRIQKQQVPLVVIDRHLKDVTVPVVRSDSPGGMYRLTQYLLQLGHRRIAMLSGSMLISTGRQRVEGYRRAMQDAGLPLEEHLVLCGEFKQESGYRMTRQILQTLHPAPTALLAGNNFIAMGILRALDDLGLRVPEDISVAGFDDLPHYLPAEPALTVVAQQPYELGLQAARLLIGQITGHHSAGQEEIVLPVELLIRQSCRPPDER